MKVTLGALVCSSLLSVGCVSSPKSSEILTPEPPASEEEIQNVEERYSFNSVPHSKTDFVTQITRSYVETLPPKKRTEYYLDRDTVSAVLYLPESGTEPVLLRVYQDTKDNTLYLSEHGNTHKVLLLYHNQEFLPGDQNISIDEVMSFE